MTENLVRDIVIVYGGWMTAVALSKLLTTGYTIRLIASDEIGTVASA